VLTAVERNTEKFSAALSVLDRLIDPEPEKPDRLWISRAESVRMVKSSLRRDLEWLLNTRRTAAPPLSLRELGKSVFVYGLRDFSTYMLAAPADRARLVRDLETAIETFEPRLDAVTIVPLEDERLSGAICFRIEGVLLMDPAPEPISFDTVLELSSGEYQVKGEAHAG
jgi:type VI secretion system protein ImpF